jgi:hypothetical protein
MVIGGHFQITDILIMAVVWALLGLNFKEGDSK